MGGDVNPNPGPVKYPCAECQKPVKSNQKAVLCDVCDTWSHFKCLNSSNHLGKNEFERLSNSTDSWACKLCLLPPFSDLFFESFLLEDSSRSPDNFSGNFSDTFELSFIHTDPRANSNCDVSVSSPS